jgi:hypothetical protein
MDMAYILCGALSGLLVGLTGVGGGALMTPLLIHQRHAQVDWSVVKGPNLWELGCGNGFLFQGLYLGQSQFFGLT